MWLEPYKVVKPSKLDISDIAEYTSPEEVMGSRGWLVETPSGFDWQSQCISGNCASASQLAHYFGIYQSWLKLNSGYIKKEDR